MQAAFVGRPIVKIDASRLPGALNLALSVNSLKHWLVGTVLGCMQNILVTTFTGSHVMRAGTSPNVGSKKVKALPKLTVIRLPGAKGMVVSRTQP
jgi:hypothetical protein